MFFSFITTKLNCSSLTKLWAVKATQLQRQDRGSVQILKLREVFTACKSYQS